LRELLKEKARNSNAGLTATSRRRPLMQCEKNGAIVYSTDYHEWFYGDLYQLPGGVWILKTAGDLSRKPIVQGIDGRELRHATFYNIEARWLGLKPYGVLISTHAVYHGYEGMLF
jgi:hypothetical protein